MSTDHTVKLQCPVQCGATNEAGADCCAGCGVPLRNYNRLHAYAAQLFNQGLSAARAGDLGDARELFAAVVHWVPLDRKARNALALASFELGDHERARYHWNQVLAQRPNDSFASTGLRRLGGTELPVPPIPERPESGGDGEPAARPPAPPVG